MPDESVLQKLSQLSESTNLSIIFIMRSTAALNLAQWRHLKTCTTHGSIELIPNGLKFFQNQRQAVAVAELINNDQPDEVLIFESTAKALRQQIENRVDQAVKVLSEIDKQEIYRRPNQNSPQTLPFAEARPANITILSSRKTNTSKYIPRKAA